MNNLLIFMTRHYHWFLLLVLEVVGMTLLFRGNSYQGAVWVSSANTMAGKVYELNSDVESFFSLVRINEDLTKRNLYLEQEVKSLAAQLEKVHYDSTFIDSEHSRLLDRYKVIPAKVVSNSVNRKDNLITIDKGEADGVHKDMGVASGNGIVGIVYLAGPHYSVVLPLLNSQSSISCTIDKRGYFGYLKWTGGNSRHAYLEDIPRHAHFVLYDKVVTSGYSSVFPPGMLVGKILHVYNSSDGLSYRAEVELSTDFANLRDVCVIDDAEMRERLDVLRAAQDSIEVRR